MNDFTYIVTNTVFEGLTSAAMVVILALVILACGIGIGWLFSSLMRRTKHRHHTDGLNRETVDERIEESPGTEDVQNSGEQADEAQEARRAFTANVSHELKTPLTVISGYAELLRDGLVRQEDIADVSSVIYEEAGYMLTLVDDILTLSQVDEYIATGNTSAHAKPVDLTAVAQGVLARLEPFARQNDIRCSLETSGDTTVIGLKKLLTGIVYNLSENAVRYNSPGGTVHVEVEGLGDSVRLIVTDTGLGISEEDQPRVFERFYQVDQAHSRHSGGTGLGLAIVKHGAQYHSGSLSLKSEPQKGTQVTVAFPRSGNCN